MAVVKIKPVKMWLRDAVDYITDRSKTDGKMLISSYMCSHETAYEEFKITLKKSREGGKVSAHHLMQAFKPGEVTPETAHEIGKRLAGETTKGRHEYILTTHIDKGHVHNHIIFCAAEYDTGKKYKSNKQTLKAIRQKSDELCEEYGLSVIAPSQNKGKHYIEYAADRYGGGSYKSKLRILINELIPVSMDFDDLLRKLQGKGYEVKRGVYISVKAHGQERFTRLKTLGIDYTEENIKRRISGEYSPAPLKRKLLYTDLIFEGLNEEEGSDFLKFISENAKMPYIRPNPDVRLIMDIQNCIKAQQSAGFARWQKIQNLKEAARTLNFLTENNLMHRDELDSRHSEIKAEFSKTHGALKAAEKKLSGMGNLIKQLENFKRTKAVYAQYVKLSGKKKEMYRKEHEADIIIHEAAYRQIRPHADSDGKLLNLAALKQKYTELSAKNDTLRLEYDRLKQQTYTYNNVKRNVDSILGYTAVELTQTRKRGAEL